ncbi:unnamed protein product [Brachionus calyciflorus]|uniref:G-protein coupled receptors family 1 profile domain-containing protein n=1 Tax=Brachionus calyciflorus TaxID=104777 RepID=A0A813YCL9_9BILA|nr:unnamed protein product [Brachionus calyciflorus]
MSNIDLSIDFYFAVSTMPLGIILNSITLFIFLRKKFNHDTNVGFLYSVLCFLNTVALINKITISILDFYEINSSNSNLISCQFQKIFVSVFLQFPSFAQVYITFDLYRSICMLNKKPTSKRKYLIIIFLTFLILLTSNSVYLSFFLKTNINESNKTIENTSSIISNYTLCTGTRIADLIGDFVNVMLRDLIPFIIIFYLNLRITKTVFKSKMLLKTNKSLKRERYFAKSIIAINIVFLIIYLPWAISFIIYHAFHFIDYYYRTINIDLKTLDLIQAVTTGVSYLNNYSPFFINLIFNSIFRKEFHNVIFKKKKRVFVLGTGRKAWSLVDQALGGLVFPHIEKGPSS